MANRLDPDQARHFVGPDLGPNCLQRLSAQSRQSETSVMITVYSYGSCHGYAYQ